MPPGRRRWPGPRQQQHLAQSPLDEGKPRRGRRLKAVPGPRRRRARPPATIVARRARAALSMAAPPPPGGRLATLPRATYRAAVPAAAVPAAGAGAGAARPHGDPRGHDARADPVRGRAAPAADAQVGRAAPSSPPAAALHLQQLLLESNGTRSPPPAAAAGSATSKDVVRANSMPPSSLQRGSYQSLQPG